MKKENVIYILYLMQDLVVSFSLSSSMLSMTCGKMLLLLLLLLLCVCYHWFHGMVGFIQFAEVQQRNPVYMYLCVRERERDYCHKMVALP